MSTNGYSLSLIRWPGRSSKKLRQFSRAWTKSQHRHARKLDHLTRSLGCVYTITLSGLTHWLLPRAPTSPVVLGYRRDPQVGRRADHRRLFEVAELEEQRAELVAEAPHHAQELPELVPAVFQQLLVGDDLR